MRPFSSWLIVLTGCVVLAFTGCSKETVGDSAEGEGTGQADTASVDGASAVETLPTVDQGSGEASGDSSSLPTQIAAEGTTPPAETPAPQSVAGTGEITSYTVRRGDTLMKIAFNIYGDIMKWRDLHNLNKEALADANKLEPGMKLNYDKPASEPAIERNGDPYKIKPGDTLGTISSDVYGTPKKWKRLWENNRTLIRDPNRIYAGFYLYYQLSEQEKQEAEQLKAAGGAQQLGGGGAAGGGTVSGGSAAPVTPPATGGAGLDSLAAPPAEDGRTPTGNQ